MFHRGRAISGAVVLLIALIVLVPLRPAGDRRPNVLFISIDDLRPELGCYGAGEAITPHIDRLASEGVRFDRAYVTFPVCKPSRAAVLTGRRIDATGTIEPKPGKDELLQFQKTFPNTLHDSGYWTATLGKFMRGGVGVPDAEAAYWDVAGSSGQGKAWSPELMDRVVAQGGHPSQLEAFVSKGEGGSGALIWQAVDCDDEDLSDGKTASHAIELIRNRPSDKPFLICVGLSRPHLPWIAPEKYFDMYPADAGALAHVPEGVPRELLPEDEHSRSTEEWNEGVTDEEARGLVRGYMASTTYADAQVGRILEALRQEDLEENTIVVVWGDHGYHLTEHGMWRKNTIYHVANRVPLIIRAPGFSEGEATARIVESIDLYPTLLELTGLEAPESVEFDGESLVPLLEDTGAERDRLAYISASYSYGVVTDRFRFSVSARNPTMLFDLENDPGEWRNLAHDPEFTEIVESLTARVVEGWKLRGPSVPPSWLDGSGSASKSRMVLVHSDDSIPQVEFAVSRIRRAAGSVHGCLPEFALGIDAERNAPGTFQMKVADRFIVVTGADPTSALHGGLHLAEAVRSGTFVAGSEMLPADERAAEASYEAWSRARKIIPLVKSALGEDRLWVVEGCMNRDSGFTTVRHLAEGVARPSSDTGALLTTAEEIDTSAKHCLETLHGVSSTSVGGEEMRRTLADLQALGHLGRYYAAKIRGAVSLAIFQESPDATEARRAAVDHLSEALEHWKAYVALATGPYAEPRAFDWDALSGSVEGDIQIADAVPFKR